jgi:hypothetical protein
MRVDGAVPPSGYRADLHQLWTEQESRFSHALAYEGLRSVRRLAVW